MKPSLLQLFNLTLSWAFTQIQPQLSGIDPKQRIDCRPESGSKDECVKRGCVWAPTYSQDAPACYYPPNTGYFVLNETHWKKSPSSVKNPYCKDAEVLNFEQSEVGNGIKLVIGEKDSFIPDLQLNRLPQIRSSEKLKLKIKNGTIASFTVERKDGTRIWDTSIGGLLFGKQYIQISTFLPTDKIYGFGEHIHMTLKHDLNSYKTWPMWPRDQATNSVHETGQNLYGVQNFYIGLEKSGKAHGVFLLNTHAQEVVTGPGPHLTYRAIGGRFEIFFLPGPTPNEVVEQYQQIVGRPYLPAYWALGYQFCRYGYSDLDDMNKTIQRIQSAQIPLDVVYADIDYMEGRKDFSLGKRWSNFPAYAEELHKENVKLTLIFDPAIEVDYEPFQRGIRKNASFISWPRADLVPHDIQDLYPMAKNTTIMLGVVWPHNHVAFPDFYDDTNKTEQWWAEEFKIFHDKLPFDGVWLDMNEPALFHTYSPLDPNIIQHSKMANLHCPSEGPDSELDNPPYKTMAAYMTNGKLCDKTICLIGTANRQKQTISQVKTMYGLKETIATSKALKLATGKRGQIISRSSFSTSGHYGGHWLGDNSAQWEALRTAIIGVQEFNMFGITHVGSDVCGFIGNTNENLCLRWQQLGAFHSFFRNHNSNSARPQDPTQWSSVANATRTANLFRYRHLPYLYSLHFLSSLQGGIVVRSVFFEFATDAETHDISYQFMWGPSILVVPVTEPNVTEVRGYLPRGAEWYYLYSDRYGTLAASGWRTIDAPLNSSSPAFLRGGSILPRQETAMTTTDSRTKHFQLVVACNQHLHPTNTASGELYWDDGETWIDADSDLSSSDYYHLTYNFTYSQAKAQLDVKLVKKPETRLILPPIEEIEIFAYQYKPNFSSIQVNGKKAKISLQESNYNATTNFLRLSQTDHGFVQLNDHLDKWEVTWKNQ